MNITSSKAFKENVEFLFLSIFCFDFALCYSNEFYFIVPHQVILNFIAFIILIHRYCFNILRSSRIEKNLI